VELNSTSRRWAQEFGERFPAKLRGDIDANLLPAARSTSVRSGGRFFAVRFSGWAGGALPAILGVARAIAALAEFLWLP
jgi:hypothetical protein